ncbi:MAG: hypothetical protein LBE31_07710 [Deltaproteobacteria bacterium]|jgi:hypothetical protein|nr:hypothetical protein [Deltaproteobacteria bacterium]
MPNIKMAIVVNARRELHLSAGEVHTSDLGKPEFEHLEEQIATLDGPAYLKIGVAQIGSVYLHGAEIVNVKYPRDSLELSWYLPDEEEPEAARIIDLFTVGFIPKPFPRPRAAVDHVWRFRVEGRGPFTETLIFQIGFQPPFKPSDLTLHLTDLSAYGFNSLVLSQLLYCHRAPAYTEGDLAVSEVIAEGILEN